MKYAIKDVKENMAVAMSLGSPISLKDSIMISNYLKGMSVIKAKIFLKNVIDLKSAVPYTRFNSDRGHKRGKIAAGRFPVKAAKYFMNLIESAESNATDKGLNGESLFIRNIISNKGHVGYHYGRRRGLRTKSVHLQIYLEELEKSNKKDVSKKKAVSKEIKKSKEMSKSSKVETKPDVKKESNLEKVSGDDKTPKIKKPEEETVKND